MEPKSALGNVMSQMPQGGQEGMPEPKQPGSRTDMLLTTLKGLQAYAKATAELDPQDMDLKMVRKIIMDLSNLLKKDQMEEGEQMPGAETQGMGGAGEEMSGAPQMPDLSSLMGGLS